MAVYMYVASTQRQEETVESGTVIARDAKEAVAKLKVYKLQDARVRKVGGLPGFFKGFTADIK